MRVLTLFVVTFTSWLPLISAVQEDVGQTRQNSLQHQAKLRNNRAISRYESGWQQKFHRSIEQQHGTTFSDIHVTANIRPLRTKSQRRGEIASTRGDTTDRDKRQFMYRQLPFYRPGADAERRMVLFHHRNEHGKSESLARRLNSDINMSIKEHNHQDTEIFTSWKVVCTVFNHEL